MSTVNAPTSDVNAFNIFQSCLNILRDNGGIIGGKAIEESLILILKLIEPHLGSEIDIDNYDYDFSH